MLEFGISVFFGTFFFVLFVIGWYRFMKFFNPEDK